MLRGARSRIKGTALECSVNRGMQISLLRTTTAHLQHLDSSFLLRLTDLVMPSPGKMLSPPPPSVVFVAFLVFTSLQFRIFKPQVSSVAHKDQSIAKTFSMTLSTTYNDGASAFDPLLPDTLRPKIRQVSMRVYNATNKTNDALDERCMATHFEYGKRWGYPTHILREDVKGKGQWNELLFSKPLYMLSLTIVEMAKPVDERAEWLV